ncbi:hypothetical protein MCC93_18340 [Morococcus cerebrosus]|uniref:Uncharacterized protein n=1 Tax=Morococcus cerebrosus TaxID=1056807 RepID=A0A0C1GJZ4_9NEIS|nr:hypothetical protein MCC93_18340 [Morococcus cerebrosus]
MLYHNNLFAQKYIYQAAEKFLHISCKKGRLKTLNTLTNPLHFHAGSSLIGLDFLF